MSKRQTKAPVTTGSVRAYVVARGGFAPLAALYAVYGKKAVWKAKREGKIIVTANGNARPGAA